MNGPEPGLEILPGLTLLRRLGRGGMGEAWLARDAGRGIDVVAKLLPGDAPQERLALLRREARLVRKLNHPRIVPVYGFHSGERYCAVTLRHMAGGDAGARRGADPVEIVRLGRDVADALAYLHDLGVVHRDVKVSNVLLDEAGRAHLADFGIATVAHADDDGIVVRGGGSRPA
jgi:serine/threonine-protein kinase